VSKRFTESVVEDAALKWFASIGYSILSGPETAPGEPKAERGSFEEIVLPGRFKQALERLNRRCLKKLWKKPSAR